jgi:hypothetical protein
MIKNQLKTAIENALRPDEEVVWAGRPDPWVTLKSSWPLFLFAIPWTLFSLAWEAAAIYGVFHSNSAEGAPWFIIIIFPLFGIPFVLVGFGMLFSPYFAYKNAERTVHVVTGGRVFSVTLKWPFGGQKIVSFDGDMIKHVELDLADDSSGDVKIVFGYTTGGEDDRHENKFIFQGIRNAREVNGILTDNFLNNKKKDG